MKKLDEVAGGSGSGVPSSLLAQGSDLLEDVQLDLPVRAPKQPAGNIMDLDAMTTGAPVDEKKKGKKKHKKEHKEHRSKKDAPRSSSVAAPAADAKPVRRRVQRTNVTRPGYGREEDHPVPVEDLDTESSETTASASRTTEEESPKSPRKDSLLSMVDAPAPSPPVSISISSNGSNGSGLLTRVSQEAQAGILSGMQIKAGKHTEPAPPAAAAPKPTPVQPAPLQPTPLQPAQPAPIPAAVVPQVAAAVPAAVKEAPKQPSTPPPPRTAKEEPKAAVPDVIEIELELPADDEPVVAVGNLLDNRASLRQQGTSALDALVEVFDEESVVPLSRGSTGGFKGRPVAEPAALHSVKKEAMAPSAIASTPPVAAASPNARSVSPASSGATPSKSEKSGPVPKSPVVRKPAAPVPRDAVSLEKEMRDLVEELEGASAVFCLLYSYK